MVRYSTVWYGIVWFSLLQYGMACLLECFCTPRNLLLNALSLSSFRTEDNRRPRKSLAVLYDLAKRRSRRIKDFSRLLSRQFPILFFFCHSLDMSRFTRPTGHASPPQHVTLYSRTSVAFSLVSFPFFSFSVTSSTCHALLAQQVTRHPLNMSRFTQGLQSPSLSSVSHSFLFLSLPRHVTLYSPNRSRVTPSTCHALLKDFSRLLSRQFPILFFFCHSLNMSRFTRPTGHASLPRHVTLYSPDRSRVTPSTCHALLTQQVTRHSLDMSRFTHPTGHASLPQHVTLYSPKMSCITYPICHALLYISGFTLPACYFSVRFLSKSSRSMLLCP